METVVLDESHFSERGSIVRTKTKIDPLTEFATKTFRRYEESNNQIKIGTFTLRLDSEWYGYSGLAARWTLKALEMGATDLTFRFGYGEPYGREKVIYIPIDRVFGSENVVSLCLERVNTDRQKLTKWSALKSLTLRDMNISGDLLFDITSCCPLIENLSLYDVYSNDSSQKAISTLHKLTSLSLRAGGIELQALFLNDLSSKFPNLKDLTLRLGLYDLITQKGQTTTVLRIPSPSLQILNFRVPSTYFDRKCRYNTPLLRYEFDVPSIRKFTFEGEHIHNMSIKSTSDQWDESRVSLTRYTELSTTWFGELSSFLASLRGSKIYLCLHVDNKKSFDYRAGEIEAANVLDVEDLTINTEALIKMSICEKSGLPTLSFHTLLDFLFRICRPKMITQYVSPPDDNDKDGRSKARDNDLFLCRTLQQVMKVNSFLIPSQYMYGLRDLEEVNAEQLFDGVWRPQPMDSILLDNSKTRFRLKLKWKMQAVIKYT